MVSHLLQPLADGLEGFASRDVVNEEHADCLAVVGIRDGSVALLAGRVPNLRPNQHVLNRHVVRCELHANRRVRVALKLVFGVSEEKLGLADL